MSYRLVDQVFDLDLPAPARWTLASLARHVNEKRRDALTWPSQATIARESGVSPQTVRRWLKWLEERGIITPYQYDGGGRSRSVVYELHLERAPQAQYIPTHADNEDEDGVLNPLTVSAQSRRESRIVTEEEVVVTKPRAHAREEPEQTPPPPLISETPPHQDATRAFEEKLSDRYTFWQERAERKERRAQAHAEEERLTRSRRPRPQPMAQHADVGSMLADAEAKRQRFFAALPSAPPAAHVNYAKGDD